MRKIIRSVNPQNPGERLSAIANLKVLNRDRLLFLRKAEANVLDFILDFFNQHQEAPSWQATHDHFTQLNAAEETVLVEECGSEQFYQDADFTQTYEDEVERQAAAKLRMDCTEAIKIATQGVTIGKATVRGTTAAVSHLYSELRPTPVNTKDQLPSSLKAASAGLDDLYEERARNPSKTYGIMTGYGLLDSAMGGLNNKDFTVIAGFKSHLKSTWIFNMIVNAAVEYGFNPMLFTSEMPAEKVMLAMVAIHSGNPKFAGTGRPINVRALYHAQLDPTAKAFYRMVKDDLINNPDHGLIRVVDSAQFSTFGSIQQRTIREDAETEVDEIWIDYLTRLPVDAKYLRYDLTTGRNETIAEAKRFAMTFKKGQGLPVNTAFQINREGYKAAVKESGKMTLTALAQYNAVEAEADNITYIYYGEDERMASEPKVGLLKVRYGELSLDPASVYVDPDCRRITDLSSGLLTGRAPTQMAGLASDEVAL